MWFSYDCELGFKYHNTAEEAKKCAEEDLQWHRDNASDGGWLEELEWKPTCWGKMNQISVMVDEEEMQHDDPDEDNYSSEFEYICDYQLKDI